MGSSGVPVSISSRTVQMQSCPFMCLQSRTQWLGSMTLSSTLGTTCRLAPFHPFLGLAAIIESSAFDRALIDSGGSVLAAEIVVCQSFVCWSTSHSNFCKSGTCWFSLTYESSIEVRDPPPSCVDTIQQLVHKAGFSRAVAKVTTADLWKSTATLYQSKWSRFLDWDH